MTFAFDDVEFIKIAMGEVMSEVDVAGWTAEVLRFTAFISDFPGEEKATWWLQCLGRPSDSQLNRPASGEFIEQGTIEGGVLELQVHPGRVDWLLRPSFENITPEVGALPNIGAYKDQIDSFKNVVNKWLDISGLKIVRFALGTVLYEPFESREGSYKKLQELLPFMTFDVDGWRDFFFQLNRPKAAAADAGVVINRLIKYAAIQMQIVSLPVAPAPTPVIGVTKEFCRVEFDLNTGAENASPIDKDVCKAVISEMSALSDML